MQNKVADTPQVTWGSDPNQEGSYWNTINPLSSAFGGTDRIPEWWVNLFPKGSERAAYMAFKVGACSLLAAGLVGGFRALKHLNRVSDMAENDNPASRLGSQLSTTFSGTLSPNKVDSEELVPAAKRKKTKQKGPKTANGYTKQASVEKCAENGSLSIPALSWQNTFGMVMPAGLTLLAAAGAYKAVDNMAGQRRNRLLEQAIENKRQAAKALMLTRARIAKGNATQKQVNQATGVPQNEDIYMKQASSKDLLGRTIAAGGLLTSALLLASALGSYKYFQASNQNNLRYKALKKGLKEYAKGKTQMTPITTVATDAQDYFNKIDEPSVQQLEKKKKAQELAGNIQQIKQLPVTDPSALNKPISITL